MTRAHEPAQPAQPSYVTDTLERLMFRVALLRDMTPSLTARDQRALDAAYSNLNGVKRRLEQARN